MVLHGSETRQVSFHGLMRLACWAETVERFQENSLATRLKTVAKQKTGK